MLLFTTKKAIILEAIMKKTNIWQKFNIYEKISITFFILNIFFYILNEDYLLYAIPKQISGYLFWLSLGLFLGFQVSKNEFARVMRKQEENKDKNSNAT